MRILDQEAIARRLDDHPNWTGGAESLRRIYTAPTFAAAIAVVDKVAEAAQELDHHPDIDIRWRTLRFLLTTHSAGGVTDLDLQLAVRIDEIIGESVVDLSPPR